MLPTCARCGGPLGPAAQFCPACGAPNSVQTSVQKPLPLRLSIDTEAMRYFVVGTRCALRMRVEIDGAEPFTEVGIAAEVQEGPAIAVVKSAVGASEAATILTLWMVPQLAGFYEVRGVLFGTAQSGERHHARFSGLQFRVAADSGPRVSVVNIDQRSARVVDNSRTSFTANNEDRGGLVSGGEWHAVALTVMSTAEIAAHHGTSGTAGTSNRSDPVEPRAYIARSNEPVRFSIKAENGGYEVTGTLSQGELATIYDGRRSSDGTRVAVKIADDKQDNDLIQAEVSALALLTTEDSPQRKHLPQVLDRFHTRDGRLGTVFEFLDGFDLTEVRRRLPDGLPVRHLIWLMRRCLSVLGWAHSRGVLHGNLDPAHIMLRARDHNVWLLDWCYAIVNPAQTGQSFRCLNETYSPPEVSARRPPLPASDIYSLGKCMFYILGGDPVELTLPQDMDERLVRFLKYCVLASPLSRAGDAWEAYRQLEQLRHQIWGAHEFIELHL